MIGCHKRYTDPSSLRKHKKNHCQFKSQTPFAEQLLLGSKNEQAPSGFMSFAEMDVDLDLKINKKVGRFRN